MQNIILTGRNPFVRKSPFFPGYHAQRDLKCGAAIRIARQIARFPPQSDPDAGLASSRGRDCRDAAFLRLLTIDGGRNQTAGSSQ